MAALGVSKSTVLSDEQLDGGPTGGKWGGGISFVTDSDAVYW